MESILRSPYIGKIQGVDKQKKIMESVHKRNIMSPKTEEINGEKHGDYI